MDEPAVKTARGRERMKELLSCAIDTFIENGYERTSIDKIIRRSGGSRSTVYQCYGSKEGLFIAALQMMADDVYASYMADYRHGRTLREEFLAFGLIYLKGMLSERAVGASRLIFAESVRLREIGDWFRREGVEKSYVCFAKVLENHIDAPLPELTAAAARFIEMLKGPLYLKALCLPDFRAADADIEREAVLSADIMCAWIEKTYPGQLKEDR
ncbi:MAG: TetR/AcrR family transcriptional regulator [Sutterella sp.]|nr:TetR/AcrR family transcriptional regulator [Sutterella sp.]